MARRHIGIRRHTGILNTNFPSTADEVFRVSQYEANSNLMAKVEACEMRALTAMRRVLKVPKKRRRRAGSVKIDNLKRPITYPRSREDHRPEREEFLARNLPKKKLRKKALENQILLLAQENQILLLARALPRKARKEAREKPILLDIHDQFQALEIFHLIWRDLEDAWEWIGEDDNRRDLTEKLGAGNPQVEKILSGHRQSLPDLREALERYEMRWADQKKGLVTKEQVESESDPVLKRELLDYLESVPDDGGPNRKRVEVMKEIKHRYRQALSLFGKIVALDQRIAARPFEKKAVARSNKLGDLKKGNREYRRTTAKRRREFKALVIAEQAKLGSKSLLPAILAARKRCEETGQAALSVGQAYTLFP
jgi:hypothetical protein